MKYLLIINYYSLDNKDLYLPLTSTHIKKLQMLTIATLASTHKVKEFDNCHR